MMITFTSTRTESNTIKLFYLSLKRLGVLSLKDFLSIFVRAYVTRTTPLGILLAGRQRNQENKHGFHMEGQKVNGSAYSLHTVNYNIDYRLLLMSDLCIGGFALQCMVGMNNETKPMECSGSWDQVEA